MRSRPPTIHDTVLPLNIQHRRRYQSQLSHRLASQLGILLVQIAFGRGLVEREPFGNVFGREGGSDEGVDWGKGAGGREGGLELRSVGKADTDTDLRGWRAGKGAERMVV